VKSRLRGRRGARLAAITSGGAIPENSLYSVVAQPEASPSARWTKNFRSKVSLRHHPARQHLWRIRRVTSGSVLVEDAHGAAHRAFLAREAPAHTDDYPLT